MDRRPDSPLRLPADCSIVAIRNVYDSICTALRHRDRLEIDCSGVDKADVTSIQLLLSTTRTAHLQGRHVDLTDISEALLQTFQRAGLSTDAMQDSRSDQLSESK